jgi:hypothetical protein
MFWYVLVEYGMFSASNFAAVSTANSTNSELDGHQCFNSKEWVCANQTSHLNAQN